MVLKPKCQKCNAPFELEYDDEGYPLSEKLCYYCFEDGVEEAHFNRLERIALENEY